MPSIAQKSPEIPPAMSSAYSVTVYALDDVDLDNHVNNADISALLTALNDFNGYQSSHNLSYQAAVLICDANQDGLVTNADTQALISLLYNGGGY
jgi:hypothetical protein